MAAIIDQHQQTMPLVTEAFFSGALLAGGELETTDSTSSLHATEIHGILEITAPIVGFALVLTAHGERLQTQNFPLGNGPIAAGIYTFKHAGTVGAAYRFKLQATSSGADGTWALWTAARS